MVKEDGTQSLIIVPALPQDSGEWTVVAQNRAGRTSISVTLAVDGKNATSYSLNLKFLPEGKMLGDWLTFI